MYGSQKILTMAAVLLAGSTSVHKLSDTKACDWRGELEFLVRDTRQFGAPLGYVLTYYDGS